MFFDVIAPTPLIPGTRIFVDWAEIEETFLVVALLTVLIEVPVFYFCGYRKPKELAGFAVVNIVSNLLLNEFLEQDRNRILLTGIGWLLSWEKLQ